MLEIDYKRFIFKTKEIWFSDYPFDIIDYDRIIFRDCKNKVDYKGFTRNEFSTLTIDLTQDLDTIWKNMNEYCRKKINRAIKKNVTLKINQKFEEFDKIQKSFRKTKGLGSGENINIMKRYGTLFIAELEGEVLCGVFYLEDKNNIRGWYAASKRLEVDKEKQKIIGDAHRLIYWEAIKYAKAKGIKLFDFGGYYTAEKIDPQMEGINEFKRLFGGKLVTHYIYYKYYSIFYKIALKFYNLKQKFF